MRKLILIILLGCNFFAEAQIIRANQNYVSNAVSYTFIGDVVTGMRQAYSFRALRSAYTGNCIRVRRSSDNTEQNFGFLNNYLDTAALLTFVGANSGFIVTWYDQSGNGFDATTVTMSKQPQIVSAGVTEKINGKISLYASASLLSFTATSYSNLTWLTVTKKVNTNPAGSVIFGLYSSGSTYGGDDADNVGNPMLITPIGVLFNKGAPQFNASASGSETLYHVSYYNRNGTLASGGINGEVFTPATVNVNAFSLDQLFQYVSGGSGYEYNGWVQEIIMYDSNKGANRTTLETNINSYYVIY